LNLLLKILQGQTFNTNIRADDQYALWSSQANFHTTTVTPHQVVAEHGLVEGTLLCLGRRT